MASIQEMKDELQALIDRASEAAEKAESTNMVDAVVVAAQTHRLDLVTALLAIVTIILAIGGLVAFFEIRYRAKIAAEDTAKTECRSIASELLRNYVNDELPDEVRRLAELILAETRNPGADYGEQDTTEVKP